MSSKDSEKKAELFIVDNSDSEWKVQKYLSEWCDISTKFDIATGHFEIGSLLSLDGKWQNLDKIRILTGDEVTRRTQKTLLLGTVKDRLDSSIENEKETNDFLSGGCHEEDNNNFVVGSYSGDGICHTNLGKGRRFRGRLPSNHDYRPLTGNCIIQEGIFPLPHSTRRSTLSCSFFDPLRIYLFASRF